VDGRLNRKAFVTTLGAAGLGLGMAAAGGRSAMAQERATPAADPALDPSAQHSMGPLDERMQMRTAFYQDFTGALADELGGTNADEVDAAIRKAMMTVIDSRKDDGMLTYGQAEALKTLVATSDAPLGPGMMFGGPPGMVMFRSRGGGWCEGHMGEGRMGQGPMGPGHAWEGESMHPESGGYGQKEGSFSPTSASGFGKESGPTIVSGPAKQTSQRATSRNSKDRNSRNRSTNSQSDQYEGEDSSS
jgi:hypothetical protein